MSIASKSLAFFMAITAMGSSCLAGEWSRTSPTELTFFGEIQKDELSKFQKIYRPTDQTFVVNSPGGNMDAALSIGQILIANKNLTIVVHGICASSCANYFFVAGNKKIIDHGIVGFHGNWKAMFQSEKFEKEASMIAPELREKLLAFHKERVRDETAFLSKAGVLQDLFDKTQLENDEGIYDIYLPGPTLFERFGIKNVRGAQDLAVVKSYPQAKIYYDSGAAENAPLPPLGER